jgi:multicomponent K+:H+ antiporter subunit D
MSFSDHLPILPVILPALTAIALLLLGDTSARRPWARRLALASVALGAVFAFRLLEQAATGTLTVYRMGDWPAPFGIVLVIDRLSAMMLMLTSCVALPVLWYASGGWDTQGRHFHALFQFQLMGLAGAFATGDIFNLFVFFEVLLIASYVLMVHGLGRERLRIGLQYVVLNLTASAFFLIGVALLYAFTGTLNLADLALRVPQVIAAGGGEGTLLKAAGLILLVVFGFKAAMVPLAMWLPATYAAACAPVAALFAIMTKVGVYAILRVQGVVFGAEHLPALLLPLALATSVVGVLGVLAAHTLPRLVAWLTVTSVGTILVAVALHEPGAWAAGLYYLLNSTLVIAGLFLLGELVAAQRGPMAGRLEPCSPVAQPTLLGLMLLLAAASAVGLPPLPGFIGKLMLLEAALLHPLASTVWTVVLGVGFLMLIGLARAGSILFWSVRPEVPGGSSGASPALLVPTLALLAMSVLLSAFAAPVQRYTSAAAHQLLDRAGYARAVLGNAAALSVRPYRLPQNTPELRP